MAKNDLRGKTDGSFPRILFVAFTLLAVATIIYSARLYYRVQSTGLVINDVRGPVLHQFVNIRSDTNSAVQECFAYVISGHEIEKKEFAAWGENIENEADTFRELARLDPPDLPEFEAIIARQKSLYENGQILLAEFESEGSVSAESFEVFERIVDDFDDRAAIFQHGKEAEFDNVKEKAVSSLGRTDLEIAVLGTISLGLVAIIFSLLIRSFRKHNQEQAITRRAIRSSEQRQRLLVEMLPNGIQRTDREGKLTFVNQMFGKMHGRKPDELIGRHIWDFEDTDKKRQTLKTYFHELMNRQPPHLAYESSYRNAEGRTIETETIWASDRDVDGRPLGFLSAVSDVTQRKNTEGLIRAENEILEAIVRGEPLSQTLERLTVFAESQSPEVFASVMLLDDDRLRLRYAAGSKLPMDYRSAIDDTPIGEAIRSCGTAASRGESIFVTDIATDLLWHDYRELAAEHGLASCWSTPIKDTDGQVLGTFAIYSHEPANPTAHHLRLMEIATQLAAVTIGPYRSRKAVEESEQRFRTIFEQAAVGVAQLNSLTGEILRVNNRYCEIVGRSETYLIGRTWMDFTHSDDVDVDQANMKRLISGEIREFTIEKRIIRPDRSAAWINLNVSPMWQRGESATEHIAIVKDITQQKADELHQRQLFNRNQGLVSALGEIVYDWRPATDQITWDGNYTQILGYNRDEMEGGAATWLDRIHPEDVDVVAAAIEAAQRCLQPYDLEYRLLHRDGTHLWVHDRGVLAHEDEFEPSRIIGVIRDISQRKQASEDRERRHRSLVKLDECVRRLFTAVRNIEPFFESVCRDIESLIQVDLCAVPIVDSDRTSFTYRAALGRNADLLIGKTMPIADGGLCGWVVENQEMLCVADLSRDFRVKTELATALEVSTAMVTPLSIEGRVIGGLSVFRKGEPFTDFELRTLNLFSQSVAAAYENWLTLSRLERRVVERTAELAETNNELESFARTVSHDLRAPLRAMEGFAAALQEDYGPHFDDEGREFVQHIIESAKRMDTMVRDLLAYSRVGRTELRVISIGLNAIVKEALTRLGSEIDAQDASIQVEEGMPAIVGHRSTLVQIVANLISNAVKFVPTNVSPEVRIWSEQSARHRIRLHIQDNGIGIDQDYHACIFNVFERLHGIESYPGTGIGLAIVAKACERLGGSYGMESTLGQGSRFWVEFPEGALDE